MLCLSVELRYALRIEAMQLQLELKDKVQDLTTAINNLVMAMDGEWLHTLQL